MDAITSSSVEGGADSDRDGLLADRDVQEARELARAEALLDLLLEATDQQHLAQEVAQPLLGQASSGLDFRHGRQCTLRPVALADDLRAALRELPEDWADAHFVVRFPDAERARRAAALLTSVTPGRHAETLRLYIDRTGGPLPELVLRALRRVDEAKLGGELELVSSSTREPVLVSERETLVEAWDAAVATLPPDWSDVYAEIDLVSTDYLEPAALMLAPTNPSRFGTRPGFRFRCARSFGYGAAPVMVRRCLERLDDARIGGEVRILHALSDTQPWSTQGPVWYIGGKSV